MRISDWSSDVCSSDLQVALHLIAFAHSILIETGRLRACRRAALHRAGRIGRRWTRARTGLGRVCVVSHAAPKRKGAPVITTDEIGRASCRERVCQYVSSSVGADTLRKTKTSRHIMYK